MLIVVVMKGQHDYTPNHFQKHILFLDYYTQNDKWQNKTLRLQPLVMVMDELNKRYRRLTGEFFYPIGQGGLFLKTW